ncbi:MAG: beta-propeller repeat protein [Ferruginibacter sp.]|nr:beta-propeller repeat protein [Ferruginibacter sp.]
MKTFCLLFFSFIVVNTHAQTLQQLDAQRLTLPNGWSLSPVGKSLPLGDLPLNMAVSSSGKYLAVTNNGQSTQTIQLINSKKQIQLDEVVIPKSWYGLKFSTDEKSLYVSAGNDNRILRYTIEKNKLLLADSFSLGAKPKELVSPAGIEIDESQRLLYTVTKENNSLYIFSLDTRQVTASYKLPGEAFTCLLNAAKQELYISCWGCDKLLVFDTKSRTFKKAISVGDNPNEICMSKNADRLFVANANDNSVSVIDLKTMLVVETLNAALYPDAPSGSTTNGLAISRNGKTLYVANADNNCLAVFDISTPAKSFSKGFIPVGWYPTNIKLIGKDIFVANGKGFSSMANPYGPNPVKKKEAVLHHEGDTSKPIAVQYIAGLFKGTLSIIREPGDKQLAVFSKAVYANTPYSKNRETNTDGLAGNPIPMKVGGTSPIKYVFYVIKENRTYDQVLGDMPRGNGDTSLVLFGKNITPNLHKLADEFVLLDNFYVDAEVSADGHNWSMGAYSTDYLEKTWPTSYGGRGGKYDAEGNRSIANNKAGFIWNHCLKNNVSFRSYGEFADNGKANITVLKNNVCRNFAGYDLGIRDQDRFLQWQHDFDSLLAIDKLPQLNTVRFGNDHTEGLRKGRPTPFVHVADNDLAVGQFVEYLSHSSIWKETAIFILEDDAQNGADHVDAHRSTAYVAGGFVRRNVVDHTMYSTSSVLRTIELILGMPPMTQYDAAATPMFRCFTNVADASKFVSVPSTVDMTEKNTAVNEWQRLSDSYNFAKEDAVPDVDFNRLLWHAVKGNEVAFPGPKRAAFLKLHTVNEQDEDD